MCAYASRSTGGQYTVVKRVVKVPKHPMSDIGGYVVCVCVDCIRYITLHVVFTSYVHTTCIYHIHIHHTHQSSPLHNHSYQLPTDGVIGGGTQLGGVASVGGSHAVCRQCWSLFVWVSPLFVCVCVAPINLFCRPFVLNTTSREYIGIFHVWTHIGHTTSTHTTHHLAHMTSTSRGPSDPGMAPPTTTNQSAKRKQRHWHDERRHGDVWRHAPRPTLA